MFPSSAPSNYWAGLKLLCFQRYFTVCEKLKENRMENWKLEKTRRKRKGTGTVIYLQKKKKNTPPHKKKTKKNCKSVTRLYLWAILLGREIKNMSYRYGWLLNIIKIITSTKSNLFKKINSVNPFNLELKDKTHTELSSSCIKWMVYLEKRNIYFLTNL